MSAWLRMGALLLGLAAAGASLFGPAGASAASPGEQLFSERCSGCHSIGGGKLVGPDLEGVVGRLGAEAVAAMIRDPQQQRPGSAMPDLGLSEAEVAALVTFLTGGATPPPAAPSRPAAGDADRGRNLFEGSARLENEGPPCLSCHSIAGIGSLGGGQLGPDLTGAWVKYGGAKGVASALATLPFPTMTPIFSGRPLTKAEQADLAAFLERASTSQRPGSSAWKLLLLGAGGAVLAVLLAFVLWPRRRLVVRRTIVDPPTIREG